MIKGIIECFYFGVYEICFIEKIGIIYNQYIIYNYLGKFYENE